MLLSVYVSLNLSSDGNRWRKLRVEMTRGPRQFRFGFVFLSFEQAASL